MRNMSFALTTKQILNRSKTVTRRRGWKFLKAGDLVMACEKCQGLGKGGKINKLCVIRIVSVARNPLFMISPADVKAEGFPKMTANDFTEMFCQHMGGTPHQTVTRIKFEYTEEKI